MSLPTAWALTDTNHQSARCALSIAARSGCARLAWPSWATRARLAVHSSLQPSRRDAPHLSKKKEK